MAIGRKVNEHRLFATLESIANFIKAVHTQSKPLGLDAIWSEVRDVSLAYYRILRSYIK